MKEKYARDTFFQDPSTRNGEFVKKHVYTGARVKKWRGTGFFFLKTRCRRVRCTSRWQFCTCRIKRSVFIRRKLFQGMRQLFSRRGEGGGGVKRDDGFYREQAVKSPLPIIPRAASSLLLLRLLFHLASPFFMFFPLSYTVVYQLPHRAHIFAWARRKVTDIFLWSAVRGRRGVWKLLNARNARFNWYESRRTRVLYIYIFFFFVALCERE